MNMRFFNLPLLFAVIALSGTLGTACVTKKKYREMETLKSNLQKMLDQKSKESDELAAKNKALGDDLKGCETEKDQLKREIAALTKNRDEAEKRLADLDANCKMLNENYNQLKSHSTKQLQELINDLEASQQKLLKAQSDLKKAEDDLAAREKRLSEVEAALNERDALMNSLRKKIADALFGFQDKGFSVEIRDGKVYVSMSNQLLFQTGSTKIDTKGQEALKELSKVLKTQTDINILVEGHTDNVKVTNLGQIKDNWDLSVMRSTEVIRLLVAEGVNPLHITASGRGEFFPLDGADTPEARAKNRRTEIVLTPKLDELYQMLKN